MTETQPATADRRPGRAGPQTLVFVSLVFPPDSSASSVLFGDLFVRLARRLPVTVLCGFAAKEADARLDHLPRRDRLGEVEVVRCGPRLRGKRTLTTRALAYLGFLLDAGRRLLRVGEEAVVVGGTDPPFAPIVLALLSRLCRWRYEQIVLDLYPDGLIGAGRLGQHAPAARLWRWLNRRAFARPARIVVIGRDMAERLQVVYGVPAERIVYIPHWGSEEIDSVCAESGQQATPPDGEGRPFVVQYSGNMGLWHDLETIVRAAGMLRDEEDIRFAFIGRGMQRAGAEGLAHALRLPNVTWADFVPRERLAESLAACDAALVSMRAGLSGVAVPSKLYGILASGRAVIAQVPCDSEAARVVREEGCGVVVEPGDMVGLAAAISGLAADREQTRRMGERARRAYRQKYTLAAAEERFLALWAPVAGSREGQ